MEVFVWCDRDPARKDRRLEFVECGNSDGVRLMSHLVGLMRCLDRPNALEQRIVAHLRSFEFVDNFQPTALHDWALQELSGKKELRPVPFPERAALVKEAEAICQAVNWRILEELGIFEIDRLGQRIAHLRGR